ncbi:MAG TPA: fibronectin type III domain-containing protein [Acidimicrobiia bacterium]|nr:fibronectin type III domain-containing protein [Acidimicrobiia bacterium]
MRIRSKAGALVAVAAMLATTAGIAVTGSPAGATVTTTTVVGSGDIAPNGPWQLEPSSNTGTYSFVPGPATPPGGVGSLAMSITTGQHEWLNNYSYGVCATGPSCNSPASMTPIVNLDALSYSTYRTSGTSFPTFNIEVYSTGVGGYTTFVFVPTSGMRADNVWQTWNGLNPSDGSWFSTQTLATGPFTCAPQSCTASWSTIQSAYPNAKVVFGLGPNLGTDTNFTGNVDDFTVGVSGATTVYNFEPDCTTACAVNATTGNDLNTGQANDPVKTIQAGINKVTAGGTVNVAAGTYRENVTVPKSVRVTGAGVTTIVQPAVSDPNCGGAGGGSLCGGSSNVFLVQSSGVTIDHLKVDGDNPTLTSSENVGGANIDARNGIITDHTLATVYNNLSVHDVTVQNIWLRGIYASSGGTFNISNNIVDNVQGQASGSIGIFDFNGGGTFSGNHVSNAADGISANHSNGTTFTGNVVTTSASGLHTDNAGDAGGSPDVITGNTVSSCTAGGYGIWTFVPYLAPTISNNAVSGCDTGLAAFASCNLGGTNYCPGGTIPTVVFSTNTVTGVTGGFGLVVSTDTFGFGDGDVHVNAHHNVISGPGTGVYVEETGTATATLAANRNSLVTLNNTGATTVAATCNWWGQTGGPITGQVTGSATTSPFLRVSNLSANCPATVPGTPKPVFAVPYNDHGAKVIWKAPANGGAPILGYKIIPYAAGVAQPAHIFNSTATSQLITGLTDGTSYRFTVAARNIVGYGSPSEKSPAMIAGAPGQPGTPTAVKVASGSLKVTFSAPMSNGAPITSYSVTCASSNGGVTKNKTGTASPITVTGLTAGKSYVCRVSATNSRGTGPLSDPSAAINA